MAHDSEKPLRLGTRGSKLARWQAEWVAARLAEHGQAVELIEIRTQGDAQQIGSLAEVSGATGTQGLFTKELQRALLDGEVDFAVHSMKDLPTMVVKGLGVAAVPVREDSHDALVGPFDSIAALPNGAKIGTGSLRRKAQLLHQRPDLNVLDIRGNVDTRLRKLDEGQYDAILLAAAGLRRLGFEDRIACALPMETMLPAPAQGALAIECRTDDARTNAALAKLNDPAAHAAVTAERVAMARLEGGCLAALGGHAKVVGDLLQGSLHLAMVVLSEDGQQRLFAEATGLVDAPEELGILVADKLLADGAARLLRERQ